MIVYAPVVPSAVVVIPVVTPSTNKVTVRPGLAIPVIDGVASLITESVVVITGSASAPVLIVIDKASDASEIFPAASVAVTVKA